FSKVAYTAKFIAKKIIEVLKRIRPEKFTATVSNTKLLMIVLEQSFKFLSV
ncbi:12751_t:CDS:2, partial [Dentiscutata heterogama]